MNDRQETLARLDAAIGEIESGIVKRDFLAAAHKLRFPMEEILAKVPGESLSDRARKVGVSRQTMYVWAAERFRPTTRQAKRISKLTGVPVAQIVDDGFEEPTQRKPKKKLSRRKQPQARDDDVDF